MKCTFNWCTEKRNPAVGVANLKGLPGFPTAGIAGQYPLCRWHYEEALHGNWASVNVVGWEPFPGMDEPPAMKPRLTVQEFVAAVADTEKIIKGTEQVLEGVVVPEGESL